MYTTAATSCLVLRGTGLSLKLSISGTITGGSRKPLRLERLDKPHGDINLHLDGSQALQIMGMEFLKLRITGAIAYSLLVPFLD